MVSKLFINLRSFHQIDFSAYETFSKDLHSNPDLSLQEIYAAARVNKHLTKPTSFLFHNRFLYNSQSTQTSADTPPSFIMAPAPPSSSAQRWTPCPWKKMRGSTMRAAKVKSTRSMTFSNQSCIESPLRLQSLHHSCINSNKSRMRMASHNGSHKRFAVGSYYNSFCRKPVSHCELKVNIREEPSLPYLDMCQMADARPAYQPGFTRKLHGSLIVSYALHLSQTLLHAHVRREQFGNGENVSK